MLLVALLACAPDGPPNVLLVTLDTVRADALGCYGGPSTPRIDALAAEGLRFDRAFTVTPLTIPAHATIHTGLWPPRHGVRDNGDLYLGEEATTLAEALDAHGYATMAAVGAEVTSRRWGFGQGFDAYFDTMGGGAGGRPWSAERRGDAVVADALAWIGQPREAPWFAWVHLFDAHDPYAAPEDFRLGRRPYDAEVAFVDAQVGALLDGLGDAAEDTWIVVVADHGESLGEHGETTHGVLLHGATTRVPLIVRPPGGKAAVIDTPVSLVDVMPTLLAAAGAPPPPMDGRDLVALAAAPPPTRAVYAESEYAWRHFGWAPQRAWMTPSHTLIASTTPKLYARADAAETRDVAPSEPATVAALLAELDAARAVMTPILTASRAGASTERTAMLEALGYVTGTVGEGDAPAGLPDPEAKLPALAGVERARARYRAGDLDGARREAEAVVASEPGLVETHMLLATVLWRQGKLTEAFDVVAKVDAAKPSARTKHLMGLLRLAAGRLDEGAALLGEAVALDPWLAPATETWLRTLLVLEDFPALATAAEAAHRNLPDSAVVAGMLGVSRALAGDAAGARPLLEAAIAEDPAQPFVHHGLGLVRAAQGDVAGARAAFEEEIRRYPPARPSRAALAGLR